MKKWLKKRVSDCPEIFFHELNSWYDSEDVFVHLYGKEQYAFWLDSSKFCTQVVRDKFDPEKARFSYMGDTKGPLSKRVKYSLADGVLHIMEKGKTIRVKKSIFEYLKEKLRVESGELKVENETNRSKEFSILNSQFSIFTGGFVGYFGYELQNECGGNTPHKSDLPDAYFFFADRIIVFDHFEKKVYLVCVSESEKEAEEWFGKIKSNIKNPADAKAMAGKQKLKNNKSGFKLARNHQQYIQDIKTCQEYLKKGESYQICLTNSFSINVQVDWLQLYLTLRAMNPAPYGVYMRFGNFAVLSSSPEKFLSITPDGLIETKPIKGTRPRGKTKNEDQLFRKELATSKKDWSENAMIVDLLRNDLGKVCTFGSIQVKKFLDVETYQTVHQLVSTIQGKLCNGMFAIDCVKACFPGGSMTGVPKKQTMEILSSLEKRTRGIYSGALGFFSLNGAAELSMIIRTIIASKDQLSIGSGGAILIDSDPEKEYDEMLLKAKVLLEAVAKTVGAKEYMIKGDRE